MWLAERCQGQLNAALWEVLRLPALRPDLLPCDFHIYGHLKKAIRGLTFPSNDYVQKAVVPWFRWQIQEFFTDGIRRLTHQLDHCLNARGLFSCHSPATGSKWTYFIHNYFIFKFLIHIALYIFS